MPDCFSVQDKRQENKDYYSIASKERAFLDVVYLNKDYHFDNLANLNWDKVFEILPIYHNKRLDKKVKEYFKSYQNNQPDKTI